MILADYPGGLIAAALLAGVAVSVFIAYRSDIVNSTGAWRWFLAILQYASAVTVIVILWDPSSHSSVEIDSRNTVLAIFDTSESMSLRDAANPSKKASKDTPAVSRLDEAIAAFKEEFQPGSPDSPLYSIYGFDGTCYSSASVDVLRRWGGRTSAHSAMSLVDRYDMEQSAGIGAAQERKASTVVGAVIFTDGQAEDKNVQSYFPIKAKGLKVLIVGVGSDVAPRDLAVSAIRAPAMAALNTPYNVDVDVRGSGLAGGAATVTVLVDGAPVDAKECRIPEGSDPATLSFPLAANALGRHRIVARATGAGDEANLSNNERAAVMEVVETPRMKVLLYSQTVNFDFGKIRSSLEREKMVDLDIGLDAVISPGLAENARSATGSIPLPKDKAGFGAYDVIILGPIDARQLTAAQVDGLYSFVTERGGGLVILPGRGQYDVPAWGDDKLKALLPVEAPNSDDVFPTPREPLEVTMAGVDSGFLTERDREEQKLEIAPFHASATAKPAAYVWARSGEKPVITIHRVGRGKVCFINAYGLYLWYREDLGGGALRSFLSSLLATLGRIRSGESRVELFATRSEEDPLTVTFEASVYDESWAGVEGATVLLKVAGQAFRMEETAQGRYSAEVAGLGDESVLATAEAQKGGRLIGEKVLAATLPRMRMEMDRVERDREFLGGLAKRIGGRYYDLEDIDEKAAAGFPVMAKSYEGGLKSTWRTWPLLVGLCLLLSATWFVRRSIGLI